MKLKEEYLNRILDKIADNMTETVKESCIEEVKGKVTENINIDSLSDDVVYEFDAESVAEDLKDEVARSVDVESLARSVEEEFDTSEMARDIYDDVVADVMGSLDTDSITNKVQDNIEWKAYKSDEFIKDVKGNVITYVADVVANNQELIGKIVDGVTQELFEEEKVINA